MVASSPQSSKLEELEFHSTSIHSSRSSSLNHAQNSLRSSRSLNSHILSIPRPILRPVITNVLSFRHWHTCNFAYYLSEIFWDFLVEDMTSDDMHSLLGYLPYFDAQDVQQFIRTSNYDKFRGDFIEL